MSMLARRGFSGWVPDILRSDADIIWDNFFDDFDSAFGDCNYENDEGDIVYQLEVPGFNKDNINVQVGDGILEVTGEREEDKTICKKSINKRLSVGEVEDAEAVVKDGVLTITLKYPKNVKGVKVVDVK